MEKYNKSYNKPKPHIPENCKNKEGKNIDLANPESDQILVVRKNNLDRKFVYLSKSFDQIVNLNGEQMQEKPA